jgi:hypothetical protein
MHGRQRRGWRGRGWRRGEKPRPSSFLVKTGVLRMNTGKWIQFKFKFELLVAGKGGRKIRWPARKRGGRQCQRWFCKVKQKSE